MQKHLRPHRKLDGKAKLVIVLIVLVLLLDLLYLLSAYQKRKEETEPTVSDETVDLSVQDLNAVTGMTWDYEGSVYSLERDDDGVWHDAQDDTFPVKQSVAEQMLSALGSITATQTITDVYDYAQYGLASPTMTLTVALGNGASDLSIGSKNPITQDYYIRIDTSKNTVYTISDDLLTAFQHNRSDILQMETLPSFGTPASITVINDHGSFTAVQDLTRDDESAVWHLEGEAAALDGEAVDTLVDSALGISWLSCATWSATRQDLDDFGLNEPDATVTVTDADGVSLTVYYGHDGKDVPVTEDSLFGEVESDAEPPEGTYARLPDSNMVYLVSTELADTMRNASADALR